MTRALSYIIEEEDLNENWRDCFGRFWHPSKIGVPLCVTCDTVMRGDVCPSCATDAEQLTETVGDPFLNRRRAA